MKKKNNKHFENICSEYENSARCFKDFIFFKMCNRFNYHRLDIIAITHTVPAFQVSSWSLFEPSNELRSQVIS